MFIWILPWASLNRDTALCKPRANILPINSCNRFVNGPPKVTPSIVWQECCGFGFSLHRKLVEAGAQSFLITPISLNGKRKTDKVDARALCQRLTRYLDGDRKELSPIRIPTEAEQRRRETTRRRRFLSKTIRSLANRGHGQVAEYCHQKLPHRWWGARNWKKLSTALDLWLIGILDKLRELIVEMEVQ
jgi:transposase